MLPDFNLLLITSGSVKHGYQWGTQSQRQNVYSFTVTIIWFMESGQYLLSFSVTFESLTPAVSGLFLQMVLYSSTVTILHH